MVTIYSALSTIYAALAKRFSVAVQGKGRRKNNESSTSGTIVARVKEGEEENNHEKKIMNRARWGAARGSAGSAGGWLCRNMETKAIQKVVDVIQKVVGVFAKLYAVIEQAKANKANVEKPRRDAAWDREYCQKLPKGIPAVWRYVGRAAQRLRLAAETPP